MTPSLLDASSPPPPSAVPLKATQRKSRLIHRSFKTEPHTVTSASGLEIRLLDGRTILDACCGAAVSCLGHANPEVLSAMTAQSQKVSYVHTQAFTTQAAEELADVLLENEPGGLEMAFFVGSGSEAVEAALKIARQYHHEKGNGDERVHFVSRKQSYHGNTMAAMSISANVGRKIPYQSFAYPHVSHVSPAYAYRYQRDNEDELQFTARLLQEIDDEFQRIGPEKIIAFVAEPVGGATAGCVPPPKGYLSGVRALCDKYGILLILDEIMCGAGRCGTFFAFEAEGEHVRPDIVTVAKGLGGGYAAIAGVLVNGKILHVLRGGTGAFVHGHTYQAHPTSCATALAVQKIIRRDGLVQRCANMGHLLEQLLKEELQDCGSVGDIRGRGLFWAVEFVMDGTTKQTFDARIGFGVKVHEDAFGRGVAIYPGAGTADGVNGDHVLLAPPYTVTEEQLRYIVSVLKQSIKSQEAIYLSGR